MDWAKNVAEKAQPLVACSAAGTAHKLESAQPESINAHLNKQIVRWHIFLRPMELRNQGFGYLNSNHDEDFKHHWLQGAAEIRDRIKILFLSSPS